MMKQKYDVNRMWVDCRNLSEFAVANLEPTITANDLFQRWGRANTFLRLILVKTSIT